MATFKITQEPRIAENSRRSTLLRLVFSFPCLLGATLVSCCFILLLNFFRVDADTWWHLLVGQRILSTHALPTSDIYSFTVPGARWTAYEWLSEVTLGWAARAAGLAGLMGVLFALTSASILLAYYYAYLHCRNWKAASVASWVVLPLAGVWFAVHPYLFGYVYLLATLICLERFRQGHHKSLWLLPLVFCLWVNSHGTFMLGGVAFAIYWLSGLVEFRSGNLSAKRWTPRERLRLGAVALLSLLASCLTPYGTRLASYPLEMMFFQQGITTSMTSWLPIPLNKWHGQLFLALVLLSIAVLATGQVRLRLEELGLLLFAVFMTAEHARALPFFAFVFAPFTATLLARWLPDYEPDKDKFVFNAVLSVIAVLGIARYFPSQQHLEHEVAKSYPLGAIEFLRRYPQPGPMFNELLWGGYLPYMLGPQQRVFIDGRLDLYQYSGVYPDYLRITSLDREAPGLLRKYNLRSCLLTRTSPLATFLEASPEWQKLYEDEQSMLFVRRQHTGETP